MASNYCSRCGRYMVLSKDCSCRLIGTIWRTEDGEEDAKDFWSREYSTDEAVRVWVGDRHCEDFEYMEADTDIAVSVRPAGGGEVEFYCVRYELAPVYTSEKVDKHDDAVAEARDFLARQLRSMRNRKRSKVDRTVITGPL